MYYRVSVEELKDLRERLQEIMIIPFHRRQLKGVGYDLTASDFIYSRKKGHLETIYETPQERFIYISPHDTVSILTYEYVKLDKRTTGNIVSRVSNVSQGLGHVSTTVDPGWSGMLLVSMHNASNRRIKFQLASKVGGKLKKQGIATMLFYREYVEPGKARSNDLKICLEYPAMRTDILNQFTAAPNKLKHRKKYKQLRELVGELSELDKKFPGENEKLKELKNYLIELKNSKDEREKAQLLDRLNHNQFTKSMELRAKIKKIVNWTKEASDGKSFEDLVESALKECDYEGVCGYAEDIHRQIGEYVKYHWPHDTKKSIWLSFADFIKQNFIMILGYSVIFGVFYICFIRYDLGSKGDVILSMFATVIPPLVTHIYRKSH